MEPLMKILPHGRSAKNRAGQKYNRQDHNDLGVGPTCLVAQHPVSFGTIGFAENKRQGSPEQHRVGVPDLPSLAHRG
jgi:hypothetical protein